MKVLSGSIPWYIKKLGKAILFLGMLIGLYFWYRSFVSGTIVMDAELLKDIESKHIENQWEKLLPLGFDVYVNDSNNYDIILTSPEGTQHFDVDLVKIYIRSEHPSGIVTPNLTAAYRRVGLLSAIWRLGSFGECTSWVTFETPKCTIYMVDYHDSDGKDEKFTAALRTILNSIE